MRVVLRGRRTWLLWSLTFWSLTFLFLLGISVSVFTISFADQLGAHWQAPWSTPAAVDMVQVVKSYRQGEQAALLTLADDVLAQLPIFTTGTALDQVTEKVAALRAVGKYQQLDIPSLEVVQVRRVAPYLEILTHEVHALTTYSQVPAGTPSTAGTRNIETLAVTYRLVQVAGRWKVAQVEYSVEEMP